MWITLPENVGCTSAKILQMIYNHINFLHLKLVLGGEHRNPFAIIWSN
jgi:hypothetical protein